MIFSLVLALAFALVAVIFALGNTDPVSSVVLGILIGILLMTPNAIKLKMALSGQKKKLKGAEKELGIHKSKLTELEEKEKEKVQAVVNAQKTLDNAVK